MAPCLTPASGARHRQAGQRECGEGGQATGPPKGHLEPAGSVADAPRVGNRAGYPPVSAASVAYASRTVCSSDAASSRPMASAGVWISGSWR